MKVIQLPQRLKLTLSLDEALSQRRTKRDCKNEPLADDVLATLLWSCAGITDKEGRRTVPSARDFRALSAYVLRSDGAWRFNAESNTLEQTTEKDVRESSTTHQPEYVTRAPVSIIFVADHKKGEALPAQGAEELPAEKQGETAEPASAGAEASAEEGTENASSKTEEEPASSAADTKEGKGEPEAPRAGHGNA